METNKKVTLTDEDRELINNLIKYKYLIYFRVPWADVANKVIIKYKM
ncbi:hypothetical protein [Clostridium akagii]|nr:hypothetical protein [Clostridium akagii]